MKKTILFCSLLAFSLSPGLTLAVNNDGEKASLDRIIHELDALQPLLKEAEGQAFVDSRIRFSYSWLNQDLMRIKQGIKEYIETPSTEPRSFEPLKGDYRQ
jgi:RAQPRD family integrative conjugative element protein